MDRLPKQKVDAEVLQSCFKPIAAYAGFESDEKNRPYLQNDLARVIGQMSYFAHIN